MNTYSRLVALCSRGVYVWYNVWHKCQILPKQPWLGGGTLQVHSGQSGACLLIGRSSLTNNCHSGSGLWAWTLWVYTARAGAYSHEPARAAPACEDGPCRCTLPCRLHICTYFRWLQYSRPRANWRHGPNQSKPEETPPAKTKKQFLQHLFAIGVRLAGWLPI